MLTVGVHVYLAGMLCWKRRDVWKQGLHSWKKTWMRNKAMPRLPMNELARVLHRSDADRSLDNITRNVKLILTNK